MTFTPKAIEAAARALCVQSGDDPDKLTYAHAMRCTGHDREPKFTWQYWMPFAEAAITAALAVDGLALQGWQEIESAPENENVLICGYGPAGYYVADAKKINGCWMLFDPPCDTHSYESYGHSHWQPLPQPPAASDREERRPPPKEKP